MYAPAVRATSALAATSEEYDFDRPPGSMTM